MRLKQTTNDCDGEVNKKFELDDVVSWTLDSGMSAPLLAQNPPPHSSPAQFCSASHREVPRGPGRSLWQCLSSAGGGAFRGVMSVVLLYVSKGLVCRREATWWKSVTNKEREGKARQGKARQGKTGFGSLGLKVES